MLQCMCYGLVPAWFHLAPAARSIVFAAQEAGSMRYMCHLQHFGLVPLGSMLQCMYYLQHVGLVPAWFHLVPGARDIAFAAHKAGSILHYMCYLQHVGLVPIVSALQCKCYLQSAWLCLVPGARGIVFAAHEGGSM